MRKARIISKIENDEILKYTPYQLQLTSVFLNNFGSYNGKPPKFNVYDVMTVPKGTVGNKNDFTTTLGLYFFNRGVLELSGLSKEFKWINKTISSSVYADYFNRQASYAMLEGRIKPSEYKLFVNLCVKFKGYTSVICSTTSEQFLTISKKLEPMKKELLKKYAKEIEAGDGATVQRIEKELLKYAAEILKDDPALDSYVSGGGASWGNNFKNMYVMKGASKDPDPTKVGYNIITSNFIEGIKKDEYRHIATSLAEGPYNRAVNTAKGGYDEKLFIVGFNHVTLDKEGSDCGTKAYITITLDKVTVPLLMYSYIVEGKNLVRLDSSNISKYMDKTVKLRFSSLCESKTGVCNKCIGDLYYMLKVYNIGTATPQLASCVKGISMKAFHDSVKNFTKMDPMKAFNIK